MISTWRSAEHCENSSYLKVEHLGYGVTHIFSCYKTRGNKNSALFPLQLIIIVNSKWHIVLLDCGLYLYIWIEAFDSNALEVTVCVKEQFVHSPCLEGGTTQETSTAIIGCGT